MTPSPLRPLAFNALERLIENRIMVCEHLYDLDSETCLRSRDGRIETGSAEMFEREAWS